MEVRVVVVMSAFFYLVLSLFLAIVLLPLFLGHDHSEPVTITYNRR